METKSRYEIIAELEQRKVSLLGQKANIGLNEVNFRKNVETAEEALKEFLSQKDIVSANLKDQLASIEKSLERLNTQQKK